VPPSKWPFLVTNSIYSTLSAFILAMKLMRKHDTGMAADTLDAYA